MVCHLEDAMKYFSTRCTNGCHGQGGLIIGPIQGEYAFDLSEIKFGLKAELNRRAGALSFVALFGPFQFALGLRYRAAQ